MPPPSNLLYVHITLICVAFYTRALLCIGLHLAQSFAVFVISIVTFGLVCMSSQFCHLVLHAAVKTCLKTAFNLFCTVAQSNNACLKHGTLGCGVRLLRCDCTGTRQLNLFSTATKSNSACLKHGCSALAIGHCTPGCGVDLHRCNCTGTRLLSACFEQQNRAMMYAVCLEQSYSALIFGDHTLGVEWIFIGIIALAPHNCHCVFCTAAQSNKACFCPVICCIGIWSLRRVRGMGFYRCDCTGPRLLSASIVSTYTPCTCKVPQKAR